MSERSPEFTDFGSDFTLRVSPMGSGGWFIEIAAGQWSYNEEVTDIDMSAAVEHGRAMAKLIMHSAVARSGRDR